MLDIVRHFGLTGQPFSKGIDTSKLYISENFRECSARLSYAVHNRCFALLTAPSGCGKSTLLRYMRDNLDKNRYTFIYIAESQLSPRWLYNKILEQFGVKIFYYRGDARKAVHEQFAIQHEMKKKEIVCVIDEAHLMARDTLEELRFFLNCDMDSTTPVSLVVSGQSELLAKLKRPEMEAIRQRVDAECRLLALIQDQSQIPEYVRAHLRACGCEEEIFSAEALSSIADYSKGLPRLINKACTSVMMYAASKDMRRISGDDMRLIVSRELV